MITFEITKKPIRTLMTVSDVEVVVGTKYPIALQTDIKFVNSTGYWGEPFDSFKYKIHKDSLSSINEGIVKINFETNKVGLPTIITAAKSLEINKDFLLDEVLLPNVKFDRIVITSITGKGSWLYNNVELLPGQIFFYYDLVGKIKFIANKAGAENNYSVLTFDTMNILGVHGQANTVTVNTFSNGGELILENSLVFADTSIGIEVLTYFFKIEKGIFSATYLLEVDTTLFPTIASVLIDAVKLYEGPTSILTTVNTLGTTNISSVLNSIGEVLYFVQIEKITQTTVENSIKITLKEINSSVGNVNPLKNEIILLIPPTNLTQSTNLAAL
jgi:hypothetical protein